MKRLLLLAVLFCTFHAGAVVFDPKNTFVLITGVLKWKNSSELPGFDNTHRKDVQLKEQLVKMGVPAGNIVLLTDEKATLRSIHKHAVSLSARCTKESTFLFYYAGHGIKEQNHFYFASYDTDPGNCAGTGFDLSWLGKDLPEVNKSNTFILMGDCCYSGGLLDEGKKIRENGRQALVFSSTTASNTSTFNWTFTQTLLDCLSGKNGHDLDRDGNITNSDIAKEIRDAMKFREHQLSGYYSSLEEFVFLSDIEPATVRKTIAASEDFAIGDYAYGFYDGTWKPVRITGNDGNYLVRFYFYSDYKDVKLTRKELKKPFFPKFTVNDRVKVNWKSTKYDATILASDNDFYYVTYTGYGEEWNEWVMYDRISTGREKKVRIEYDGNWYPGEILIEKGSKCFVRYQDYGFSWDEWVNTKRIKPA